MLASSSAKLSGPRSAPTHRRLFFALWPDEPVAAMLSRWAQQQAHAPGDGRLLPVESLHLTVAFLGATPITQIPALCRLLDTPGRAGGTLVLDRLGYFRGPRIVWAGPSAHVDWLETLHAHLWQELCGLGWSPPNERFCPHVSLLRNASPRALLQSPVPSAISWAAHRLVLAASTGKHTGPGPLYEHLASRALQ